MSSAKYIGLDVHQATIVAAMLDQSGKLVMESILETKASTLLEFRGGIRGELNVTLGEACAAWLHRKIGFTSITQHRSRLGIC